MQQAPPPPAVRGLGYAAAAWSLGFAGVSVWLVAGMAGEPGKAGLVILSGDPVPLGPAARLTPPRVSS
jgi:hypothetical protein